jgi:hypothetical protein
MTSTTVGQLEARAFSSAGLMKAKIARDAKAKLHQKARAGSVNAEQAKAVVRVFEMSAAGFDNRRIVTALNAESVLASILRRDIYLGRVTVGKTGTTRRAAWPSAAWRSIRKTGSWSRTTGSGSSRTSYGAGSSDVGAVNTKAKLHDKVRKSHAVNAPVYGYTWSTWSP